MKFLFSLLNAQTWWLVLAFFVCSVSSIQAKENQILFINQVRGEECCDPGNLDNTQNQIDAFIDQELPAYFALRYDALINQSYTQLFTQLDENQKELIKPAIFLEITPSLAAKANVTYKDDPKHWYLAQNAYTVGYSPEDRIKLMDVLFASYLAVFETYPEVSVGWLVDTTTLNYLHDKYGVKVHEITREQWGTDSYTLDGGPEHYPYPASKNWAFIPDYSQPNSLLIVRQTISDPLFNYGDTHSRFTSQPNDYQQYGRTFDYFAKLINQAMNQPNGQTGFALLGLENSMSEPIQAEYIKQIEYVAKNTSAFNVSFPDASASASYWHTQKNNVYLGDDFANTPTDSAAWINTPTYKARVRNSAGQVFISDLRFYNPNWHDPYNEATAYLHAHWVVPFVLNGARIYGDNRNLISKIWFHNPYPYGLRLFFDKFKNSQQLYLGNSKQTQFSITKNDDIVEFLRNNQAILKFNQYEFYSELDLPKPHLKSKHPLQPTKVSGDSMSGLGLSLSWQCVDYKCNFKPTQNINDLTQLRKNNPLWLFPETDRDNFSLTESLLFAHNPIAMAGRNPVRVVLLPQSNLNVPSQLKEALNISVDGQANLATDPEKVRQDKEQFYDFNSDQPTKNTITFKYQNQTRKLTIIFAPNCKEKLMYCATHPVDAWWYLRLKVREQLEKYQ